MVVGLLTGLFRLPRVQGAFRGHFALSTSQGLHTSTHFRHFSLSKIKWLDLLQVTVILTGMFDPVELESQLGATEELEEEVAMECAKMGPVEKVRRRTRGWPGAASQPTPCLTP